MTKAEAISQLRKQIDSKVDVLKSALADSEEGSSGDETKSEGKYDTRAVEASYLAQAQADQLEIAEQNAGTFKRFEAPDYDLSDPIGPGALVETDEDGEINFYFLAPTGGGMTIDFLGCELTVITPDSRLYQSLLEKKMGDQLESPSLMVTGIE
ncbi:MAG: hypothetical protein ACSHYF_16510 [Verrucomicrobiaceae bacterium]